jgi:hypothetical protein
MSVGRILSYVKSVEIPLLGGKDIGSRNLVISFSTFSDEDRKTLDINDVRNLVISYGMKLGIGRPVESVFYNNVSGFYGLVFYYDPQTMKSLFDALKNEVDKCVVAAGGVVNPPKEMPKEVHVVPSKKSK